jgi:hypothetical protein
MRRAACGDPVSILKAFRESKQMNAGCLFTNGTHVLAGYQPNKQFPSINGIGGKPEEGDPLVTALREFLEEVFGIYDCVKGISALRTVVPRHVFEQKRYITYIYDLNDLVKMLEIVSELGVSTPLYLEFPRSLIELLFTRQPVKSEISHLCLIPLVQHGIHPFVEPYFLRDLSKIHHMLLSSGTPHDTQGT